MRHLSAVFSAALSFNLAHACSSDISGGGTAGTNSADASGGSAGSSGASGGHGGSSGSSAKGGSAGTSTAGKSGSGGTSGSSGRGGASGAAGASGASGKGGASGAAGSASGGTSGSGGSGAASGAGGTAGTGGVVTYGATYGGGEFHLGPVDWDETKWHNACAPGTKYASTIRQAEGTLLAGLWGGIPNVAGYCDACIYVTTARGKSALLRVVTYGATTTNSIDVSQQAFDILNSGEYPRSMSWQFAKCPDTGPIYYEFQLQANPYWTSLWVRNARVPISKVEVKSPNHTSYSVMTRSGDGTLTDASGFGQGPFTIRLTGTDGQQITDTFSWPSSGIGGITLTGQGNFQ